MLYIKAKNDGEAWIKAMSSIMASGEDIFDEDVPLREIRNMYITIDSIQENDAIISRFADRDRIELMKKKYATCGLVGDYKIDYGSYIYDNNGVNQIDWIIKRMKGKPETKSATITLHRAGEEKLACLSMIDFKYRDNMLDMTIVYRSQNMFWSHPGNMLALNCIHHDVAEALGYTVGKVELVVISAHIYAHDFETVNHILNLEQKENMENNPLA